MRLIKIGPSTYEHRANGLTYRIEPGYQHGQMLPGNFTASIWRGSRRLHSRDVVTRAAAVNWLEAHSTGTPQPATIRLAEFSSPGVELSLRRKLTIRCQTEKLVVVSMAYTIEKIDSRRACVLTAVVAPMAAQTESRA